MARNEFHTLPRPRPPALLQRCNTLANRNARLTAIIHLYDRISENAGLDSLADTFLSCVMELFGGVSLILYYKVGDSWRFRDVFNQNGPADINAEKLPLRALHSGKTVHVTAQKTMLEMTGKQEKKRTHTLAFPLLAFGQGIGVLLIRDMIVFSRLMIPDFEVFLRYFSRFLYSRIVSETNLQEAYAELDNIFRTNPDGMAYLNADGRIVRINPSLLRILGKTGVECIGNQWRDVFNMEACGDVLGRIVREEAVDEAIEQEWSFRTGDGALRYCIMDMKAVRCPEGRFKGIICNVKDITELKTAEQKLRRSLEEKELMMREIHHRVKNNLQVVYSLVKLQQDYITHPGAIDALREIGRRIRSMGMIHDRLYQSDSLDNIDFTDYVRTLKVELSRLYATGADRVEIAVESGEDAAIRLHVDMAAPCGLIINELLSNALKYAFPGDRRGRVTISLLKQENCYLFSVADNGRGFPDGFDPFAAPTLGLKLVQALAEQLEGTFRLEGGDGVSASIKFPSGRRGMNEKSADC